jgi:hypothetical protein
VRSDAYRCWLHDAGWHVRAQAGGFVPIIGTFNAEIVVPERSRRDRDNWTKSIFDLLQLFSVVRNDSGLRSYSVRAEDRGDVLVLLWDLGGPEQVPPRLFRLGARPKGKRADWRRVAKVRATGVLV